MLIVNYIIILLTTITSICRLYVINQSFVNNYSFTNLQTKPIPFKCSSTNNFLLFTLTTVPKYLHMINYYNIDIILNK
jgi:hypothetical protein